MHGAGQRYKNALLSRCKFTDSLARVLLARSRVERWDHPESQYLARQRRHVESTRRNLLLLLLTQVQGVECPFHEVGL